MGIIIKENNLSEFILNFNNINSYNLFSDTANDYAENMSEVEIKTEPNKFDELFFDCKSTNSRNNVSNSTNDGNTSESMKQI